MTASPRETSSNVATGMPESIVAGRLTLRRWRECDVERIEIHMDRANLASARIPEKLGFQLLRTERREPTAAGHTGTALVWQTTRAEWSGLPPAEISPGDR